MGGEIITPIAYQRPSGRLDLSADQLNLVSASITLVLLDVIPAEYTDGIENTGTHRITPGQPGFYAIAGQVTFKNVIADKNYYCEIRLSGGALITDVGLHSSFAAAMAVASYLPSQYMSAVDYIELYATSFAGVNTVDIDSVVPRTFLSLQRVR